MQKSGAPGSDSVPPCDPWCHLRRSFFFSFFPLMSNALKPTTLGLRALSSLAVYLSSTVK